VKNILETSYLSGGMQRFSRQKGEEYFRSLLTGRRNPTFFQLERGRIFQGAPNWEAECSVVPVRKAKNILETSYLLGGMQRFSVRKEKNTLGAS
jgi:hypothetical protein